MQTNPKTSAEFFSLPIGPEKDREVSRSLYPLENEDILRITETATGKVWEVWQYKDGERFRFSHEQFQRKENNDVRSED